ncbi:MAG TPA: tRNA adenosine(34) deaminase TadA [Gammaproteobacteria bacterium]|nr:tRNA adenosine(34) deaminase TadA [Gammaproteobacteria bacterium]
MNSEYHQQSLNKRDCYWMQHALTLAKRAEGQAEVPVGAVVVASDRVIGEGWNQPIATSDPTAHAEIVAIRASTHNLQNYRLPPNSTLYVTLEPCAMCAGALINARLSRLVYGALDPKAGAVASVFSLLDRRSLNHQVIWEGGCLKEECATLLQSFFQKRR